MIQDILIQSVIVAARVLAAMALSAGALYCGMGLLDRLTAGVDEWKEIKKGNLAFGLLFAAVMLSIVLLVEPRITDLVTSLRADLPPVLVLELLGLGIINYLACLFIATGLVFLTIHLIDRITPDLDEMAELKKGNLAVALILSVALVLVIFAVRAPVESAFRSLLSLESLLL
ncbi:MAG: DUF350 domain-containing protein [Candidatus Micrarchaeia archaeon]